MVSLKLRPFSAHSPPSHAKQATLSAFALSATVVSPVVAPVVPSVIAAVIVAAVVTAVVAAVVIATATAAALHRPCEAKIFVGCT